MELLSLSTTQVKMPCLTCQELELSAFYAPFGIQDASSSSQSSHST